MKTYTIICAILLSMGLTVPSFASDWDKAGKILTGVEGVRILTGGRVDIIGSLTGINSDRQQGYGRDTRYYSAYNSYGYAPRQIWVSCPVYEQRWVPAHREFRSGHGWVYVPGHYVRYQVADNGYWATKASYREAYNPYSRY